MKIRLYATLCFFIIAISAKAQEKKIQDIVEVQLRNAGSIINNEIVVGHYLFYKTDRINRKTYNYELQILDQNLNEVGKHTVESSKHLFLMDAVYNGNSLMLKLYDYKNDKVMLQQLDNSAKLLSAEDREVGKIEKAQFRQMQSSKGAQAIFLFPLKDFGFADFRTVKNKNYGYSIDYYSSQGGKNWNYSSDPKLKTHLFPTMLYGDEDIMMNIIMEKDGLLSKDFNLNLMVLDSKTGKPLFRKSLDDSKYKLSPINGFRVDESGNFHLLGYYYNKESNIISSKSLGLFQYTLNNSGEIVSKNYISWTEDAGKFFKVDEKGEFEDFGYVFFHDFVEDNMGNFYAIGEQYDKEFKGLGFDIVVKDMMIFKFDKDFNLTNIETIEKAENNISVPNAALFSPQMLAMIVKALNGYDYEFTTSSTDKDVISIGYQDYLEIKKESDKYVFGNVFIADGKLSTDTIDLMEAEEEKRFKVLPSEAGYIVVLEYDEKEKELSIDKVKLNY
ncbi:hypothetical protein SAMN05661096_02852 [Marivirga sericea]|uniref:Uncharacterized protein n=1 Tax=Marivirga sericea TaxID=1028 RepID=A0A1X7KLJ6_9BACT|nr:DUF6770 family protein [Marivirga sericea]SMG42010.1 hypothetical protein SAMN05661096_02852 [Marivirga sericea]